MDTPKMRTGSTIPQPSSRLGRRRDFVKKVAYVTPAILTLIAAPSYAKSGSDKKPKKPDE